MEGSTKPAEPIPPIVGSTAQTVSSPVDPKEPAAPTKGSKASPMLSDQEAQDIDDMLRDGYLNGDGPDGTTYYDRGPDGHLHRASPVDKQVVRQRSGEDMPESWGTPQGRKMAREQAVYNRDSAIMNGTDPKQAYKEYANQLDLIDAAERGGNTEYQKVREAQRREREGAGNTASTNNSGSPDAGNSDKTSKADGPPDSTASQGANSPSESQASTTQTNQPDPRVPTDRRGARNKGSLVATAEQVEALQRVENSVHHRRGPHASAQDVEAVQKLAQENGLGDKLGHTGKAGDGVDRTLGGRTAKVADVMDGLKTKMASAGPS